MVPSGLDAVVLAVVKLPSAAASDPAPQRGEPATAFLLRCVAAGFRPAALVGSWFGYDAVVAPHVLLDDQTSHGGRWFFGYRAYEAADAMPEEAPNQTQLLGGHADRVFALRDGVWFQLLPVETGGSFREIELADAVVELQPETLSPSVPIRWDLSATRLEKLQQEHRHAVEQCLEAIRAGEVYQTCISTRFTVSYGEPLSYSERLRTAAKWFCTKAEHYQPSRAAFLPGDEAHPTLASLSPEEFLIRRGNVVRESPIKGTVPADHDPEELLRSRKDVAENIMIVDLVRHDLGQVANVGGVKVTDLLAIRPAPGVWHLVSEVTAELPPKLTHHELIDACFPPASVTGTPKLRAAELLRGWELQRRGVHCGAIGAAVGDALELNVAIRTVEFYPDCVAAGVGGGITIDSTPEGEWQEILAKARPLLG